MRTPKILTASLLLAAPCFGQTDAERNVEHSRHHHPHGAPHPTVIDAGRFTTSRSSEVTLPLPAEEDAFSFVVFGDRTGGPDDGVNVLADAVRDTNLLEPDFVITVGDLIQGYNTTSDWMWQMREYRAIMSRLVCPWFPVAGNHDVYWRGPNKPAGEHEHNYEMHFGPLWYAFEHKGCWFIVLYSDEGDPLTDERTFGNPFAQRMSDEQLDWLRGVLGQAADAPHVFAFLHHPRWRGGSYGNDWEKVHRVLADAGNVSAVFAGHIHQMRYRERDGIEYVTLATVGGHQGASIPRVGHLHQYNVVTVRDQQVAMTTVPVGAALDPREITDDLVDAAHDLLESRPIFDERLVLEADGSCHGALDVKIRNPTPYAVAMTATPRSDDSRWVFEPDHLHDTIPAGTSRTYTIAVHRDPAPVDPTLRAAEVAVDMHLLTRTFRYEIPTVRAMMPADVAALRMPPSAEERVLAVDGRSGYAMVEDTLFALPDGPFTLETWLNADAFGDRSGLVCKTESSEYGIFVSGGRPEFFVFLGDGYTSAGATAPVLGTGTWHHVAGVYDGREVKLYVDGALVARTEGAGPRRTNRLPLLLGADVLRSGAPTSHFDGRIDGVRLSTGAVYTGARFEPARRLTAGPETVLLFNMDGQVGPWLCDESDRAVTATLVGGASVGE